MAGDSLRDATRVLSKPRLKFLESELPLFVKRHHESVGFEILELESVPDKITLISRGQSAEYSEKAYSKSEMDQINVGVKYTG
jgi:hypothetical protein